MSNSEILALNKIKGKLAEALAKKDYEQNGYIVKKTGIGSDYKVIKKYGEKIDYEYIDVKFGNAKLTKKQKQTQSKLKQKGIKYSVYRVTPHFLQYQMKHDKELEKIIRRNGYDLSSFIGKFIIKDPTNCPNCGKISHGFGQILINFGLRNMGNEIVRVQSWCRKCRHEHRERRN